MGIIYSHAVLSIIILPLPLSLLLSPHVHQPVSTAMLSDFEQMQQALAEGDGELAAVAAEKFWTSVHENSVEGRRRRAQKKEDQDRSIRALLAARGSSQHGLHAPEERRDGTLPLRYTVAACR